MTKGEVFPVGSRVRVTSESPWKGLKGTIRRVHTIASVHPDEEPFCFYPIALEGSSLGEPIWFECHEVEVVALPFGVLQARN
jgi:hypothetical protein